MSEPLPTVEIDPRGPVHASVIWLHGLGADGHDFVDIIPALNLPDALGVRFVLPHAPQRPVTINNGYVMRAWYDIAAPGIDRREDERGIRASAAAIEQLIAIEHARGVPYRHILLAGFSQGGAIVLHCGLRFGERLGGIIALSTYLPLADSLASERHAANAGIPILMCHGSADGIIPMDRAEHSRAILDSLSYPVEWHRYRMAHQVCPEEIDDIAEFIQRQVRA